MDVKDSQVLIDFDKGGGHLGPLFEDPQQRLQEDPRFRQAWMQYQGIRALAWETAPELDERLVRQGLQAGRRQEVERRLARATGSQDAARELLLDPAQAKRNGLPVWVSFLLLAGAVALGWKVFGPFGLGTSKDQEAPAASFAKADSANAQASSQEPLTFEFPADASATASAAALGQPPPSDETHSESPEARRARRLLLEHLRHNEPVVGATSGGSHEAPVVKAAQATAVPTRVHVAALPSPLPTAQPRPTAAKPTAVATRVSSIELVPEETRSARPTPALAIDTAAQILSPRKLEGSAAEATLTLSSTQFPAQATLSLPEAGTVDLRLFDMRGRLVHRYAEGEQGAGRWRYNLSATDDQGRALGKGSYYLRVITRWFSKVEALEQP
jgi:hypothetical protein